MGYILILFTYLIPSCGKFWIHRKKWDCNIYSWALLIWRHPNWQIEKVRNYKMNNLNFIHWISHILCLQIKTDLLQITNPWCIYWKFFTHTMNDILRPIFPPKNGSSSFNEIYFYNSKLNFFLGQTFN